ncbi:MAG TPA: carboxypeptidase-like regulatory domain-containing protein, partial [Terracidiphilus sp.]|nr:carboxypeptidase-like regulatory domain-containing protein [Terracidiphilus sp.]
MNEELQVGGRICKVRGLPAWIELSAIVLLAASSFAQVDRSGLSGTVSDTSGRVLPEAHVKVVESATGLHRETVS